MQYIDYKPASVSRVSSVTSLVAHQKIEGVTKKNRSGSFAQASRQAGGRMEGRPHTFMFPVGHIWIYQFIRRFESCKKVVSTGYRYVKRRQRLYHAVCSADDMC